MTDGIDEEHLVFVRSSRCVPGDCVEFARDQTSGRVYLRHSDDPTRTLSFSPTEWDAFAAGMGAGEFETT